MSERARIVAVSARTHAALTATRVRLAAHLRDHPELSLDDVATTLARGREPFAHRYAVTATGTASAAAGLERVGPASVSDVVAAAGPPRLVFAFGSAPATAQEALAARLRERGAQPDAVVGAESHDDPQHLAAACGNAPAVLVLFGCDARAVAVASQLAVPPRVVVASSDDDVLGVLAELWCCGVPVDLVHGAPGRRLHLPGYAFDRGTAPPAGVTAEGERALARLAAEPLGGDPLGALALARSVRAEFGVAPELRDLLACASHRELVVAVAAALARANVASELPATARPLTARQQRLLFHDLARSGSSSAEHNVAAAVEIAGDVDAALLDAAFADLQREHPVLRTVFRKIGERWFSVEEPGPLVALQHRDVSGAAGPAEALAELARHPLALVDAPLMRAELVTSARYRVLALVLHTAAADVVHPQTVLAQLVERVGEAALAKTPAPWFAPVAP